MLVSSTILPTSQFSRMRWPVTTGKSQPLQFTVMACAEFSHVGRRFLDLMTLQSDDMLVPTLDIDLVWHTHQLTGQAYQDDCMNLVGRYIDQ